MSSKDHNVNFKLLRNQVLARDGKQFWRSLDELADSDEFGELVQREFPQQAEEWDNPVERRTFLKIMGASLALAGLTGCSYQPPEAIVPYVRQPEDFVPGKPLYYATSLVQSGIALGLLARSNEGRPTKIEGNPEHPGSLGATNVFAQGELLTMYDPDRSRLVTYRAELAKWDKFLSDIRLALDEQKAKQGSGIRFLTETVSSPTFTHQMQMLLAEFPQAKWYQYETQNRDGSIDAFGQTVNTVYKFDQANRILALDSDFLTSGPTAVRYARDFAARKRYNKSEHEALNRLYVVESSLSLTGAKADHRWALRPSEIEGFARAVARALGLSAGSFTYDAHASEIAAIVRDLQQSRGSSIVIAGDEQPAAVHALAHMMNEALGNIGKTVLYVEAPEAKVGSGQGAQTQVAGLRELVTDIDAGKVDLLVMVGGNPVYNAPADLKLGEHLMAKAADGTDKLKLRVHLSLYDDETSELCHWHIPAAHFLESWGDARAYDGTVTLVQPLIEPLYGGKSAIEFLSSFSATPNQRGYDLLRAYWQTAWNAVPAAAVAAPNVIAASARAAVAQHGPTVMSATPSNPVSVAPTETATNVAATPAIAAKDFETWWRRAVHDGFVAASQTKPVTVTVKPEVLSRPYAPATGPIEFVFRTDASLLDGRYANNGWLQELPRPLTKITWDNAVILSPKTATALGLKNAKEWEGGQVGGAWGSWTGGSNLAALANLKVGELTTDPARPVPIWIQPAQPDGVATLHLGYGRTRAGSLGGNTPETSVGFDACRLRSSASPWSGTGSITSASATFSLATTQLHFNMEGRDKDILRTMSVEEFETEMKSGEPFDEAPALRKDSIYHEPHKYEDYKWGMTIDLASCNGCNACVVACQSENNIPVVGKEQVQRSREMQWLRVDAYYKGTPDDAEGPFFMPVLCMQCENAPCEPVCPVHATVHSSEGLNDMVYNRCVGTRYCSNNCPYKVRRFNFLLYQDWTTPTYQLMRNPEVSVRSRGVMEKCTYCVQRIQSAKIEAEKDGNRRVRDGEVVTACQAACPAEAIVFGDMNDPESMVAKRKAEQRNYSSLADLNTQPRTTYLADLRNPNTEIKAE